MPKTIEVAGEFCGAVANRRPLRAAGIDVRAQCITTREPTIDVLQAGAVADHGPVIHTAIAALLGVKILSGLQVELAGKAGIRQAEAVGVGVAGDHSGLAIDQAHLVAGTAGGECAVDVDVGGGREPEVEAAPVQGPVHFQPAGGVTHLQGGGVVAGQLGAGKVEAQVSARKPNAADAVADHATALAEQAGRGAIGRNEIIGGEQQRGLGHVGGQAAGRHQGVVARILADQADAADSNGLGAAGVGVGSHAGGDTAEAQAVGEQWRDAGRAGEGDCGVAVEDLVACREATDSQIRLCNVGSEAGGLRQAVVAGLSTREAQTADGHGFGCADILVGKGATGGAAEIDGIAREDAGDCRRAGQRGSRGGVIDLVICRHPAERYGLGGDGDAAGGVAAARDLILRIEEDHRDIAVGASILEASDRGAADRVAAVLELVVRAQGEVAVAAAEDAAGCP